MDLPDNPQRADAAAPARLCGLAGPAYGRAELETSEYLLESELDRVRAYPVPSIAGLSVSAPDEQDLYEALETFLRDRVCGFAWKLQSGIEGPMRKYGLLHTSLVAPPSPEDGPAMWLELSGTVIAFGGEPLGSRSWFDLRPFELRRTQELELPGPIEVRIDFATYANDRYPGVGVPFYI